MKIIYSLLLLFSIVNCDLDHEYSHTHSISDGHSTQHSSIIMHSDTGFNIEYLGAVSYTHLTLPTILLV